MAAADSSAVKAKSNRLFGLKASRIFCDHEDELHVDEQSKKVLDIENDRCCAVTQRSESLRCKSPTHEFPHHISQLPLQLRAVSDCTGEASSIATIPTGIVVDQQANQLVNPGVLG